MQTMVPKVFFYKPRCWQKHFPMQILNFVNKTTLVSGATKGQNRDEVRGIRQEMNDDIINKFLR